MEKKTVTLKKLWQTAVDPKKMTTEKIVGKQIQVGDRTLIPIISVSRYYNKLGASRRGRTPEAGGFLITPIAFVVIDPQGETVLSLQRKDISLNYLKENIPHLTNKIKMARARDLHNNLKK